MLCIIQHILFHCRIIKWNASCVFHTPWLAIWNFRQYSVRMCSGDSEFKMDARDIYNLSDTEYHCDFIHALKAICSIYREIIYSHSTTTGADCSFCSHGDDNNYSIHEEKLIGLLIESCRFSSLRKVLVLNRKL